MPADFGPRIPQEGVEGQLVVTDPEDACTAVASPKTKGPWIALILRSERQQLNCSFDAKVRRAQDAGAAAVVVYDDVYEALIIMAKPLGNPDPDIPAVFVSQKSGIVMRKLVSTGLTVAQITPASDALWMSMLLSAFAGILAVTVVIATFYFISRRHRIRALPGQLGYRLMAGGEEGMSPAELRALPVVIHEKHVRSRHRNGEGGGDGSDSDSSGSPLGPKGGGTLNTCAVCIEDYKEGDKLRVLPCRHRFHMECIDQWLSSRKPLCPICKWDALVSFINPSAPPADLEAGPAEPTDPPRPPARRWRWIWGRTHRQAEESTSTDPAETLAQSAAASLPVDAPAAAVQGQAPPGELSNTPNNFPNMHAERLPRTQASSAQERDPEIQADNNAGSESTSRG